MGIFDRTNYVELGRTIPSERFSDVFGNVSGRKQSKLIEGAIAAFNDEHPENIQAILAAREVAVDTGIRIITEIMDSVDDKAAAIERAFKDTSPEFKKRVLDTVLHNAIHKNEPAAEEVIVAALLKSGADANASYDGYAGSLLAFAIYENRSASVIKLLVDGGASTRGALLRMQDRNAYTSGHVRMLMSYHDKTANASAATAKTADAQVTLQQLQQQMVELTKAVELLPSRIIEAINANAINQNSASRARLTLTQQSSNP